MDTLYQAKQTLSYGGKINHLLSLRQLNLPVPNGLILSAEQVMTWLADCWPELAAPRLDWDKWLKLDRKVVQDRLESQNLPFILEAALEDFIEVGKTYIVRSSALLEDQATTSFAGQYDSISDCQTMSSITAGIKACVLSLLKPQALAYWHRQGRSWQDFGLAILIQEQCQADYSGVYFTLNPESNQDQEMLIEYVAGAGEQLVSGRVNPKRLSLAWYEPDLKLAAASGLSQALLARLHEQAMLISAHFGRPMDVEWCACGDQVYLVQARPMTTLPTRVSQGRWTTANFRDGGVAAQSCPNLMWSLYFDAWQESLSSFLEAIDLAPSGPMPILMRRHHARPYWNLGVVKAAMQQIPGYIERDFDDELGVNKDYEGRGYRSQLSLDLLTRFIKVAWKTQRLTKNFMKAAPENLTNLQDNFKQLETEIAGLTFETSLEQVEALWRQVILNCYRKTEQTYFWQAYINTVQLSMQKTRLLKWLSQDQFFQLIADLGNISHTQPLEEMLALASMIRNRPLIKDDWAQQTVSGLVELAQQEGHRDDFKALADFMVKFGHHSRRELDLRVPSYMEEPEQILALIQRLVLDDAYYDKAQKSLVRQHKNQGLPSGLTGRQSRKIKKIANSLRHLLWWREEFKDCSTHAYHLIRQVSLALGRAYLKQGYLEQVEDIFYLTKWDLLAFMNDKDRSIDIQQLVNQDRHYCQSYDKCQALGDLTEGNFQPLPQGSREAYLSGMPASSGQVTGRVRVILDFADIASIQPGEILVTAYTDTGWSYVFGILGGLIAETGGVLCHASIVARECGIPALVCVQEATKRLKTGMLVTLDAEKGKIHLHED